MQPETKYKLADVSEEEKNAFMKDFDALLKKHSVYFEPIPQIRRENLQTPWKIVTEVLLQKKVEVVEVEKVSEPVPSTDPSVNPTL